MWYSLTNDWKLIQSEHKGENMKKQKFNATRRLKLKEFAISNMDNKLKKSDIFSVIISWLVTKRYKKTNFILGYH